MAVTRVSPAVASESASAPRASTTRSQPRSSSARVSASPSPREAPVTIPIGMRRMMHLQVHLKSTLKGVRPREVSVHDVRLEYAQQLWGPRETIHEHDVRLANAFRAGRR